MPSNLYTLQLHEIYELPNNIRAMRVPGGWIYHDKQWNTGVFVPFDTDTLCVSECMKPDPL